MKKYLYGLALILLVFACKSQMEVIGTRGIKIGDKNYSAKAGDKEVEEVKVGDKTYYLKGGDFDLNSIGRLEADWDGKEITETDTSGGGVSAWTSREGLVFNPTGSVAYSDSSFTLDGSFFESPDTSLFTHSYYTVALVYRYISIPTSESYLIAQADNFNNHFYVRVQADSTVEARHSTTGSNMNRQIHNGSGDPLVAIDTAIDYVIVRIASNIEQSKSRTGNKSLGGEESFSGDNQPIQIGDNTAGHNFKVYRMLYFSGELNSTQFAALEQYLQFRYLGGEAPSEPAQPLAEASSSINLLSSGASTSYETLQAADDAASPGDTIKVGEGVVRLSGTFALNTDSLTLLGSGKYKTTVKGSSQAFGWVRSGNTWKAPFSGAAGLHLVTAATDTPLIRAASIAAVDTTPGTFFAANDSIYTRLLADINPNSVIIDVPGFTPVIRLSGTSLKIENIGFQGGNGFSTGTQGRTMEITDSSYNDTIRNISLRYSDYENFAGNKGYNMLFERNEVSWGGRNGFGIKNTDEVDFSHDANARRQNIMIRADTFTGNNWRYLIDSQWEFHDGGIKIIPSSFGVTIDSCYSFANWGPGYWADHPIGEIVYSNNTSIRDRFGVFHEISEYPGGPTSSRPDSILFGARIINNKVVKASGIGLYVAASRDVITGYNTVYNSDVEGSGGWAVAIHGLPRNPFSIRNTYTFRNILLAPNDVSPVLLIRVGDSSSNHFADNNYYIDRGRNFVTPPSVKPYLASHPSGGGFSATASTLQEAIDAANILPAIVDGSHANSVFAPLTFEDTVLLTLAPGSPAEGYGATARDLIAPAQPTLVSSSVGAGTFTITWNAVAEPDLYQYVITHENQSRWTTSTSYTWQGVTSGTFTVESEDRYGNRSAPLTVTE